MLLGSSLALFAVVTWLALESQEVALLRTTSPTGSTRETRVWVAREGALLWVEAATPERVWYRDILRDPNIELDLEGGPRPFLAEPFPGPEGHAKIRSLLRQKYGWADAWVGLLQDTSASIAVRLAAR